MTDMKRKGKLYAKHALKNIWDPQSYYLMITKAFVYR
jgi:hypothetical protein